MYKIVAVSAIAIAVAFPANAGSRSEAAAGASANSNAAAQAISLAQGGGGGNVNIVTRVPASTRQEIRTSGTSTIRSAPQVVAPGFSSGHPCAFAPLSVGVSVIGFGGAFGGQRIDDACLLAQMGERGSSVSMIAARNPAACAALLANGRVRSCGNVRQVRYAVPVPTARPVAYTQSVKRVSYASLKSGQTYRKVAGGKVYRKR